MTEASPHRAVYDCNVMLQALLNPYGPAGACVDAVRYGRVKLYMSERVLREIEELPAKTPVRLGVTHDRVHRFVVDLMRYASVTTTVPSRCRLDRDPDDAHYLDLALASSADVLVTRDRDLLDLRAEDNEAGERLRRLHPSLRIVDPAAFLHQLDMRADRGSPQSRS